MILIAGNKDDMIVLFKFLFYHIIVLKIRQFYMFVEETYF